MPERTGPWFRIEKKIHVVSHTLIKKKLQWRMPFFFRIPPSVLEGYAQIVALVKIHGAKKKLDH